MAEISIRFAFERSIVQLNDGSVFEPVADAVRRWETSAPAVQRPARQRDFQIVYELRGDSYVIVLYSECDQLVLERDGAQVEIWQSTETPRGSRIEPIQALRFLVRTQSSVPENLRPFLPQLQQPAPKKERRPLEFWTQRDRLGSHREPAAHLVDVVAVSRDVAKELVLFVQRMRRTTDGPEGFSFESVYALAAFLFGRYRVDHEHWWSANDGVPPENVGLLELRWPPGTEAIREPLISLQTLLRTPFSVLCTASACVDDPDRPTAEELRAAKSALEQSGVEIEDAAIRLRNALDAFTPGRAESAESSKPRPKKPSNEDFFAWFHARSGCTQAEVVKRLLECLNVAREQGTVSRMIARVDDWLGAGGSVPHITELVPEPRARPMDPAKLDLGANPERRSPRQRAKKG